MPSPLLPETVTTYAEAERALLARWPETRLEPSLDRIAAFTELLGEPQRTYPVVHLTGTNGKTTTARMVDTVLRAMDLRTGRFTSPHVESMTERICLDGDPVPEQRFLEAYNEVAAIARLVDEDSPHPLSFFEMVVGMAYATFADAPVDAAVVEVGMGGAWDATNVADAAVAVIGPVAVDHSAYLGSRPVDIAREKAGIIKAGSRVVSARQADDVAAVIAERAAEVGAELLVEGRDFGIEQRVPAVGGQVLRLSGRHATYDEVLVPLYGAHQAQNAVVALAAVEAFFGTDPLDADLVRAAFEQVTSPGRLEVIRRSPAILLDVAHNPHGAEAVVDALGDSFALDPLIGVVGVMADKDYEGVLAAFEPVMAAIVCTQNTTPRALRAEDLAEVARGIFGSDRVHVAPRLDDALDLGATLAEQGGVFGEAIGSGGVLVTGSVVTVGEARTMLKRRERG
jgi:dihydrofolate synthase/folylpolyglutamate synthase